MTIKMYRRAGVALVALYALAGAIAPAAAQNTFMVEQTTLRLSVYQFDEELGQYARWDALSGDIAVEPGDVLDVPVVGLIKIEGRSPRELASVIGAELQKKLGLKTIPDTRVEIASYPPVYVVGTVEKPGEFTFRPGMTVLQALALGGGVLRSENSDTATTERVRLLAELRGYEDQLERSRLRVARLMAALSDAKTVTVEGDGAADGLALEQAMLDASRTARDRQVASLTDLQSLYQQEIEVLEVRIADLDKSIASTQSELSGVEKLVANGIATVGRRSELERALAAQRSDRLDHVTAVMRAKQFMTEAERSADGIEDDRRSELTQEWLTEKGTMDELTLKVQGTRSLLAALDAQLMSGGAGSDVGEAELSYTIIRKSGDVAEAFDAAEDAVLYPGDVVKVSRVVAPAAAPAETTNEQE